MPTKTWKSIEMHVARLFGSTRTPLSGGNGKITRSDSLHPQIFLETKYRARVPWIRLYRQVEALAAKENKLPVVVIVERGNRMPFLIAPASHEYLSKILLYLAPPESLHKKDYSGGDDGKGTGQQGA